MATINKNQGESITIDIILGESIELTNVNEIVVSLGDNLLAKYSLEELIQNNNVFTWRIKSDDTRLLLGIKDVIVSIDLDGYGNRKTVQSLSSKINFLRSDNPFSNTSLSTIFVDLSINVEVVQDYLVATESVMNIYRGKNALELYQEEKGLPNATLDDMNAFYAGRQTIIIEWKQDGDIISHNLEGHVTAEFFDESYQRDERISIEYVTDSSIRFKTSVFADIFNTPFNGFLRCVRI